MLLQTLWRLPSVPPEPHRPEETTCATEVGIKTAAHDRVAHMAGVMVEHAVRRGRQGSGLRLEAHGTRAREPSNGPLHSTGSASATAPSPDRAGTCGAARAGMRRAPSEGFRRPLSWQITDIAARAPLGTVCAPAADHQPHRRGHRVPELVGHLILLFVYALMSGRVIQVPDQDTYAGPLV